MMRMKCKHCGTVMDYYESVFEKHYYNPDVEYLTPIEHKSVEKFKCPKCRQTETRKHIQHYNNSPSLSEKEGLCPFCKEPIRYLILVYKWREFRSYDETAWRLWRWKEQRRYHCPQCGRLIGVNSGNYPFEFPDLILKAEWNEKSWRNFYRLSRSLLMAIRSGNLRKIAEEFRYEPYKGIILEIVKLLLSPEDYAKFLSLVL